MKIEDCKVGMKVIRRKRGKTRALKEGEKYTIKRIYKNSIWIKENPGVKYLPKYFEPVNKFEVGDGAIYKAENSRNYKCTIFGIAEQKDKFDGEYAISFEKGSGRKVNKIVKEKKLSPIKKKDELEVGDGAIFTNVIGEKYEVKIWGISDKADSIDGVKYGISINYEGRNKVFLVKEDRLSPFKKKDELGVGDKFKVKTAEGVSKRINEILGVFKDEYFNQTKYVAKRINGNYEGFVDIYNSEMIAEIIYD